MFQIKSIPLGRASRTLFWWSATCPVAVGSEDNDPFSWNNVAAWWKLLLWKLYRDQAGQAQLGSQYFWPAYYGRTSAQWAGAWWKKWTPGLLAALVCFRAFATQRWGMRNAGELPPWKDQLGERKPCIPACTHPDGSFRGQGGVGKGAGCDSNATDFAVFTEMYSIFLNKCFFIC